ncbi:hypothetical protein GYB62_02490, partial [bacterium]|nr:hypothetical protein [bacterium]
MRATAQSDLLHSFSQLEVSGHILSALLFVLIAVIHRSNKRRAAHNLAIQLACLVTAIGEFSKTIHYLEHVNILGHLTISLTTLGAWLIALALCIQQYTGHRIHRALQIVIACTWLSALIVLVVTSTSLSETRFLLSRETLAAISLILVTLSGIVLIEQLYRNATMSDRDNIKYLCLGLAILFSFDLYDYTYTSLFSTYDPAARTADGIITLFSAVIILLSALRSSTSHALSFSRPMAFYSTSTIAGGLFLMAMAIAAYYVRAHGGSWGNTIQLIVLFSTSAIVFALLISRNTRRQLTVFINKHFFSHKYDYRHVWLKLIDTLSKPVEQDDFYQRGSKAVASIVESPGGCLGVHNKDQTLAPVASWNMPLPDHAIIASDSPFCGRW